MDFNPRFPRGKRHGCCNHALNGGVISIHASRGGSDVLKPAFDAFGLEFQSTLPAGEATAKAPHYHPTQKISIHASRGGSDRRRREAQTHR